MSLAFVLFADRRFERVFLFATPPFAGRFQSVATHGGEDARSLFAAHYADARVRRHPEHARLITATAHRVITRTETAADDHGEFRHVRTRDRSDHLRAILGNAGMLVFAADH